MLLFFIFLLQFTEIYSDTPYTCGAHGYCYPANRTSSTDCASCTCAAGTTQVSATECEGPTSCTPTPCTLSNQQCTMVDDVPDCSCAPGYTGTDCTMLTTDPCSPQPCLQNGVCTSSGSTYSCSCSTGFYGDQCQYAGDPCSNYCTNGGTCTLLFDQTTPYCQCPFDYYGETCQTSRFVSTTYTGCFDDQSASFSGYYVYSTTITTGTACAAALVTYRTANPTSTYDVATMSGTQAECMFSTSNTLTDPPTATGLLALLGAILSTLLATCAYANVNQGMASVYTLNDMCTSNPCGEASDYGKCVQTSGYAYECICSPLRTGTNCGSASSLSPCSGVDCGIGTCGVTDDQIGHYCSCPSTNQTVACVASPCSPTNPCLYGGTCNDLGNGSYTCECLNLYMDANCQTFNPCYINQCVNDGTCIPSYDLLDSTFTCACGPDWKGTLCQTERLYCDEFPCANNGTCENIVIPPNSYNCTCTPQWQGRNCTEDVNECLEDPTICTTKDSGAQCVNTQGSYYCICSADMYGTNCNYNKLIYEILNGTYGSMGQDQLDQMVNDLSNDPTLAQDIIPFLIGSYDVETRTNLSWNVADLFLWVAYEQQLIDLDSNFYQWNDITLGNCFTFNHMNSSFKYMARGTGYPAGLEMQISVGQSEYLPWIQFASIMVFTATENETITSESVSVNNAPSYHSSIAIDREDYLRLGGKYGQCVKSKSEYQHYYYAGDYTTNGCLRTCYQDVIEDQCGCMDPRYPIPETASACNISKKSCIDDYVDANGDPSQWKQCNCPNPCTQTVYSAKLSRLPFTDNISECELSLNSTACYNKYNDMVWLRIGLPKLDYLVYDEQPTMDFNKFLSYLGGILSILCGVSIVSFIELFFLIINIIFILFFNRSL